MGEDGTPNQPTIPAYMVSRDDGAPVAAANGTDVTIGAGEDYFVTGNDDFMASFSSQGPTDVDFRVKPDVVAPGVNVLSSIPHQFCDSPPCFAFFQGTSMATPHLAGSAAVVQWLHPTPVHARALALVGGCHPVDSRRLLAPERWDVSACRTVVSFAVPQVLVAVPRTA